jgi:hypothetical protein
LFLHTMDMILLVLRYRADTCLTDWQMPDLPEIATIKCFALMLHQRPRQNSDLYFS